jgi:hypothetical protein
MALKDRLTINTTAARQYLHVDDPEEDALIEPMIEASIEQAEKYIGHDFTHTDENGDLVEETVPMTVHIAVLRTLAGLYEWRDEETASERLGDETRQRAATEIPHSARSLLFPYRKNPGV